MRVELASFGYDRAKPLLGRISLNLEEGRSIALLGPSGVGKSTLLNLIAGLMTPSAPGAPGAEQSVFQVKGRPEKIGYVFQEPCLLPWADVRQNIRLVSECSDALIGELLNIVGLDGLEGRLAGKLSLGQQRRVSLARALSLEPDLLLLDEPFASLDAERTQSLLDVLFDVRTSNPALRMLIATHSISEAKALADRIFLLDGLPAQLTKVD